MMNEDKKIKKILYTPEQGNPIEYTVIEYPINFWGVNCYQVEETNDLISMRPSEGKIEILEYE